MVLEVVALRGAVLAFVLVGAAAREEEVVEAVGATLDPEVLRVGGARDPEVLREAATAELAVAVVEVVVLDKAGAREAAPGAAEAAEGGRLAADVAGLAPSTGREGKNKREV